MLNDVVEEILNYGLDYDQTRDLLVKFGLDVLHDSELQQELFDYVSPFRDPQIKW